MLVSKFRLFGYQKSETKLQHQRDFTQVFFRDHLGLLDTDVVSVTTLLPGHQQCLHKNYHFGKKVSLLMRFFQNAVVMRCKQQQGNVSGWIKLCVHKVSWDQDSGISLWHNHQQSQEGPQICWTRKRSFRVAMRFPDVTKSLKRNHEAELCAWVKPKQHQSYRLSGLTKAGCSAQPLGWATSKKMDFSSAI